MSVYYVLAPDLGMVKIGLAANPKARFHQLQTSSPSRLVLLAFEDGDASTEAARHAQFADLRQRGEWFKAEGALADHIASLQPIPVRGPSLNKQLIATGISKAYASQILSGKMVPAISLAIHIFRHTGWRHPRLDGMSDQDMAVFERFDPWRSASEIAA